MLRGKRAVSRVDGVLTSGRIFCGKPPKSAIADLGNIECRSRVNPRSVSTPDQVRGRLFPENALGIAMGLIERLTADAASLRGALRTLKMTTPIAKNPTRVFPAVIAELADKYGDAPALISEREHLSYRALAERANRY